MHEFFITRSSAHARVERVTDALSNARMGTETCDGKIMHGDREQSLGIFFLRLTHQAVFYGVLVVPNGSR